MTIEYLQKMQQHPKLRGWTNQGMTDAEIEALETRYNGGNHFPKSYREFLSLGGHYCNLGDIDTGDGYDWLQTRARQRLQEYGQDIGRPFWVTAQLDDCEQFGFIYLDEANDDPAIYNSYPAYVYQGDPLVQAKPQGKFSNYINECVDRAIVEDKFL